MCKLVFKDLMAHEVAALLNKAARQVVLLYQEDPERHIKVGVYNLAQQDVFLSQIHSVCAEMHNGAKHRDDEIAAVKLARAVINHITMIDLHPDQYSQKYLPGVVYTDQHEVFA